VKSFIFRAAIAALCVISLAGCIDSVGPILPDAQPEFGPHLRLQFYSLRNGFAREPEQANFNWNGALYSHAGGGMKDFSAFSVHPFDAGDYIIQEVPAKRPRITEYGLLHRIADGAYLVVAIDEDDADEPTRAAYCGKGDKADPSPCRIETREQLFAFARATAARQKTSGGLVLRLPDGSEKPERPAKRKK
jgi:hypothetical protein